METKMQKNPIKSWKEKQQNIKKTLCTKEKTKSQIPSKIINLPVQCTSAA